MLINIPACSLFLCFRVMNKTGLIKQLIEPEMNVSRIQVIVYDIAHAFDSDSPIDAADKRAKNQHNTITVTVKNTAIYFNIFLLNNFSNKDKMIAMGMAVIMPTIML